MSSHRNQIRRLVVATASVGLALATTAAVPAVAITTSGSATTTASAPTTASATASGAIPNIAPKGKQLVGKVSIFADPGMFASGAPSGSHYCQASGRDNLPQSDAGRWWMFVQDYTTEGESFYKNDSQVVVTRWADGKVAFNKFTTDKLMCTWLDPQQRVAWSDKNPQRYWLSTSGKVYTKYTYTAAMRVGNLLVTATGSSTKDATAKKIATGMALATEHNIRVSGMNTD